MENILVPTDFSREATNAVETAALLAKKFNTKLTLLHVIEAPTEQSFNVEGEMAHRGSIDETFLVQLVPKIKEQLNEIVNKYPDIDMSYEIEVGSNAYNSIRKLIGEKNCALIVMGTKGASGADEILVGSNTEKVVRAATCPVLSLKEAATEDTFKEIVFPTDMGAKQAKMVDQLKEFQKTFNSKLHVVKINTPSDFQPDRIVKSKLEGFAQEHNLENYTLNIFNDAVEGDGIMYFAEDIKAGMIAMATHGRTGLSHFFSGSIAEDIVNHADRPVLTFNIKD